MKVAILMMQKNEVHLLPTWIKYHAEIFGFENIYIFDNGSDIELKDQLKIYSEFGLNVNLNFTGVNNFENKGKIFGNLIKSLEAEKKYDFFIPLDCDEFIAVEKSDGLISCERDDIFLELAKHSESKDILMIGYQLYNDVSKDSKFYKEFSRKCFFYKETFLSVDVGFHWAKVKKSSKEIKTNIIQFHFHNRPYFLSKKSALQKMAKRVDINNNILLRDYDGPGFHLKNFFIMNEEVWKKSIEKENFVDSDVLSKKLSNLKLIWPFSDFVFFEREIFFFDYKKEAVVSFEKCDDRQHSNGWVDGVHISEGSAFFNGWWVSDKNKNTLSEEIEIVFVSGLKVLFTAKIIFLINRFDIKEKYNLKFSDAGFKMSPVKLDFKESDIEKMECYLVFQGKQIVNIKIHENVIKSLVNFNQIKK